MDYKTTKRLVYAIKDCDGMTLRDANTMIYYRTANSVIADKS